MDKVAQRALLIVNPSSRSGSEAELDEGLQMMREAGIELIDAQSKSAEHSRELIREHKDSVDFVILGGGDGTISSVASCLLECNKPFAILPLGTANDLARSLEIPQDIEGACEVIIANHCRRIDLGCVNGHYFFNVANIGLGVRITYELTPEVKKHWGVFSYLKAFLNAFSRRKVFRLGLEVDGRRHRHRSIQLAVGNGRYYGGGNVIDENALIDSGVLCLYSLKPQTLWELLTLAPLLRGGKHRKAERIFTECGREITVHTSSPMEVHADGEPVTHTPATFKILHDALQVLAPKTLHARHMGHTPEAGRKGQDTGEKNQGKNGENVAA